MNVKLEVIQKTALLGTAKILRIKVVSLYLKRKEKRDLGPVVTSCNPLLRTINQANKEVSFEL